MPPHYHNVAMSFAMTFHCRCCQDVIAFIWAFSTCSGYYLVTILLYLLCQNILGYGTWDASVAFSPEAALIFVTIAFVPAVGTSQVPAATRLDSNLHSSSTRPDVWSGDGNRCCDSHIRPILGRCWQPLL